MNYSFGGPRGFIWRKVSIDTGRYLEGFCRHVQAGSVQTSSIADMQRASCRGAFEISNPARLLKSVYSNLCVSAQLQNHLVHICL